MAIQEFQPEPMSEEEMNRAVQAALAAYGRTPRDFEHAMLQYNSDFFRGESDEFKRRMCTALHNAFLPQVNRYWQNNSEVSE